MRARITGWGLWLLLFGQGILLTFGLPPFQKFDEVIHWQRAATVTRGNLFCPNKQAQIPRVLTEVHQDYNFWGVLEGNLKFDSTLLRWNKTWSREELEPQATFTRCELNFLGYIPNAIGLALISGTNNPLLMFYGARIFGFLFFLLVLRLTLINTPKKFHPVLWFYALLPMVVHQVTAISYDVVILSLILPLTAMMLKNLGGEEWSEKNKVMIWSLVTILGIIKYVYWPLILIYLVLEWDNNKAWGWKKKFLVNNLGLAIISLGVVGLMFGLSKGELYYPTFINPRLQLQVIKSDPLYFGQVLINTFGAKWLLHLEEMVGVMGWKNVPLDNNIILIIVTVAVIWVSRNLNKTIKKVEVGKTLAALLVVAGVIALTTVIMYLVWTIPGNEVVEGIQGRYWLPLIPYALIFGSMLINNYKSNYGLRSIGLIVVAFLGLNSIYQTLNKRYWDWSGEWKNSSVIRQEQVLEGEINEPSIEVDSKKEWLIASSGERVSGVMLELRNGARSIIVPYRYEVRDASCKKVLRKGYLDPWQIQYNRQTVVTFKPVAAVEGSLCFSLAPLPRQDYGDWLMVKEKEGQPDIVWLYY